MRLVVLLVLFLCGVDGAKRVVIKQTYKQHPLLQSKGLYEVALPKRVSQVKEITWCSSSYMPGFGRIPTNIVFPTAIDITRMDCRSLPMMNVRLYPSAKHTQAVEVDVAKQRVVFNPGSIPFGDWQHMSAKVLLRSELRDPDGMEVEQIIRFNPNEDSGDDEDLEGIFANDIPPTPVITTTSNKPVATRINYGIVIVTAISGLVVCLITVALVYIRRKKPVASDAIPLNRSGYEFQVFSMDKPERDTFDEDQQILMALGKGANSVFETNNKLH